MRRGRRTKCHTRDMSTPVPFTASTTMRRPNVTTKRPPNSPGNARSTGSTSTCAVSPKLDNGHRECPSPGGRALHKKSLTVSEHRRFEFADRQCLTAMCNQPKQLLRILHIFVAYLTFGDGRFQ